MNIADGDATPSSTDHSDFGSVATASSTVVRTFTIENSGTATANLTLGSVTVGGTHTADFTVNLQPTTPVTPSGGTTFQVTFDPSAPGQREATLSFGTNDTDENPFNFTVQGTGTAPEINLTGNNVSIVVGDTTPDTVDHMDFGNVATASGMLVRIFTIQNTGTANLTVSSIAASGAHAAEFAVGALTPAIPIGPSGGATFTVTFDPGATGTRTATITVNNNDSDEATYDFAIQGTGTAAEINVQGNSVNIADGDTTGSHGLW